MRTCRLLACTAALLAIAAAGCAAKARQAYEGPERSAPDVATVVGTSHRLILLFYNRHFSTLPESVDDYLPDGETTEWLVLPGSHTVHVVYGRRQLWMLGAAFFSFGRPPIRQSVNFTAEGGRRYRVDGQMVQASAAEHYCAWVEDEETGEVVGGAKHCSVPTPVSTPETGETATPTPSN